MDEISVYLFLGFLDSGKTKFIQETFEDPRMEDGGRTLLLVCEEGEEEYDPHVFNVKNVTVVTLESAEELTFENLDALSKKHKPTRVVVEYNGTWLLNDFFEAMPDDWVINQMMTFFDATTFLNYNANMRQLVFDKIQMTQMVVFNRFAEDFDKMEFHKIVRGISRRPEIVYEHLDGNPEYDEIEDPLPFDVNAPVIEIEDRDFAWFCRDLSEKFSEYVGKTVKFKGMAAVSKKLPTGYALLGRHIMTCCEADTQYNGFPVKFLKSVGAVKTRDWFTVTGKITLNGHTVKNYDGPIIVAEEMERSDPPETIVATFY